MSVLKLTKNELRNQQTQLNQLQRYLPTLQLKKSMLQFEVNNVYTEITVLKEELVRKKSTIEGFSSLLLEKVDYDLTAYADIQYVKKRYENIEQVVFRPPVYFLYDTPAWTESATALLQDMVVVREQLGITQEKRRALERELREVSIRVNLFEKILIPRAQENIKKIRIFLGDQMLTAVAQAKVAKAKILKAKKMEAE
jgi:V/A-type H+-transporting ATPase subunit D